MPDDAEAMFAGPPPDLGPAARPEAWPAERVIATFAAARHGDRDLQLACALLWHDHLDAAHRLVQRHEGDRWADTLHAIMHRREPDEDNSRYWWRRVGTHPLQAELGAEAVRLGLAELLGSDGRFDPARMAMACCRRTLPVSALVALQACELRGLAGRLVAP